MSNRTALLTLVAIFAYTSKAQPSRDLVVGATYEMSGTQLVERIDIETLQPIQGTQTLTTLLPDIVYLGDRGPDNGPLANQTLSLFRFVPYSRDSPYEATYNGPNNNYVFYMPAEAFLAASPTRIYDTWKGTGAWEFGVMSLPVKLRRGPFNFEPSLSLGPSLSRTYRSSSRENTFFSLSFSTGISSVDVSTPGATGTGLSDGDSDRAAFYVAGGVMWQLDNVQVGVLTGRDYINGVNQDDWVYQGRQWFSVGLGLNVFLGDRGNVGGNVGTQSGDD